MTPAPTADRRQRLAPEAANAPVATPPAMPSAATTPPAAAPQSPPPTTAEVLALVENAQEYGQNATASWDNLRAKVRQLGAENDRRGALLARWELAAGMALEEAEAADEHMVARLKAQLARWEKATGMTLEQAEDTAPRAAGAHTKAPAP